MHGEKMFPEKNETKEALAKRIIVVGADEIKRGTKNNSAWCPTARALMNDPIFSDFSFSLGSLHVYTNQDKGGQIIVDVFAGNEPLLTKTLGEGKTFVITLPPEAVEAELNFDAGKDIVPYTFEIYIPQELIDAAKVVRDFLYIKKENSTRFYPKTPIGILQELRDKGDDDDSLKKVAEEAISVSEKYYLKDSNINNRTREDWTAALLWLKENPTK